MTHGEDACAQGPPGTGKTQLLKALVHAAVGSGLTVGLAAFTHAAVDNAFSRLWDLPLAEQFVRVGKRIKIKEDVYDGDWIWRCRVDSFGDVGGTVPLVAATAHSWILSSSPAVDVLIIDEAAQMPAYMGQAVAAKARHLVCLGDHRQLPPVLQPNHAGVAAEDMFSLLLDENTPMLTMQYRMNRHVQSWSAERYYGGHLHPHPEVSERDVVASATGGCGALGASPVQLITHDHKGDHRSNAGEAALVAGLVEDLLRVGAVRGPQVGVIAPHRMQNGAICRALQERLGCEAASAVRVDTVERFQGQEREVIVLSFGCDFESPAEEGRRAVFLGDPRRINVSVTRARSRFYCLASGRLREISGARRGQAQARELRDFLDWCRAPAPERARRRAVAEK